MVSPSHIAAQPRSPTRRDPLARYRPRSFSQASRWRFVRDRRALYLGQVRGELTEAQKALIDSLISLEWSALVAEAAHTDLAAARESRESRRLFQRLIADFERSIVVAAPRPVVDQRKLLNDYLARREAGEAA